MRIVRGLRMQRVSDVGVGRTGVGGRLMFGLKARLTWELWKRNECAAAGRKV